MEPLNLKELFGKRYKIGLDPAAKDEAGGRNDPWYYQILCRFGHIYPYSDKLLAYFCVGSGIRAKIKKEHPEIDILNWSDDGEATFLFPLDQFEIMAEYARPRRRRRLSKNHREKLTKAGTDALRLYRNPNCGIEKTAPESTQMKNQSFWYGLI